MSVRDAPLGITRGHVVPDTHRSVVLRQDPAEFRSAVAISRSAAHSVPLRSNSPC